MATVVPYQGAMDPLGLALGQGLGQGITTGWQQRRIGSDVDALLAWLANMQNAQLAQQGLGLGAGMMAGGPLGPGVGAVIPSNLSSPVAPPTLKTPEVKQMLLEMQLGQMLNPLQQAQVGYYDAQRREALAREQALLNPPSEPMAGRPRRVGKDDPSGLPEGSVVQDDRYGNTKIIWQPAKAPERLGIDNKYGLRPGTVIQEDRYGETKILHTPHDPEADKTEFERGLDVLGDQEKWSSLTKLQQQAYIQRFLRPPDMELKTWEEQVNYWQTILRQTYKTGDWGAMLGEVVEGLEGLNTRSKQAISDLLQNKGAATLKMKDQGGTIGYVPARDVMRAIDMGYQIMAE